MPWEGTVGSSSYQVIGLRFAKIPLAKDADLLDATVQFTADNDDDDKLTGGPVNLIINGLLQANPGRLTSGENFYTDRNPKTTAEVPWTDIPDWTNGEATPASRTADISSVIREIIGQDGWAEGNALMLFVRDDETKPSAATRSALSFDAGATVAPLLKMTLGKSEVAGNPSPADKAVDVPLETVLSWQPGFSAVARNVYFGTDTSPALVGMTTGFTSAPKLNPSTTYYWKIEEIEANGTKHAGGVWSFTTVPAEATVPSPADGATNVAPDATLSWKPGVRAVSHDVYFGMSSPPPFIGNQAESSYNSGGLRLTGTFYWQIDEIDADGTKHIGTVWSFSTLSGQASTPDPAEGALIEQTYALLGWTAGQTAVSHNVYISSNLDDVTNSAAAAFAGNVTTTNLSVGLPGTPVPDGLVPGSTYYWRVDELEADPNVVHQGVVWSFSVLPDKAHNPSPADAATGVATNAQLSWSAGLAAKLHSVYFGDNADTVANAVGAPPLPMTTKDPGPLEPGKTYYWRVDEFNPPTTIKGDVWSFTTAP
jgi:hypothetical protein